MKNNYIRSIVIAIVCSLLFSLIIALISMTPALEQLPNHLYHSFSGYMMTYLIFLPPAFISGGLLSVWLMGLMIKSFTFFKNHSYLANLLLHCIGAIVIAFVYLIFLSGGFAFLDEIIFSRLFLLAISASLLYFHLYIISSRLILGKSF